MLDTIELYWAKLLGPTNNNNSHICGGRNDNNIPQDSLSSSLLSVEAKDSSHESGSKNDDNIDHDDPMSVTDVTTTTPRRR